MKVIKWLILSSIALLVAPVILYYIHFGAFSFSKHFKDWVDFSQYYSVFIGLFNAVILVFLTWRIHRENIALYKPILIFTIGETGQYPHSIKNIGNGPAINIEIFTSRNTASWDRKIKGLTLGKGESYLLKIPGQTKLGAIYQDQTGQQFKCHMINTSMKFDNLESEFSQNVAAEIFTWQL